MSSTVPSEELRTWKGGQKLHIIEITDTEVISGLKGMKKRRAHCSDEICAEMVNVI